MRNVECGLRNESRVSEFRLTYEIADRQVTKARIEDGRLRMEGSENRTRGLRLANNGPRSASVPTNWSRDRINRIVQDSLFDPGGGARLLTSRLARTLAPPVAAKCATTPNPVHSVN